jgi:hypothetical protein
MIDKLKGYSSLLGTGLLKGMAPQVASGFINGMFHQRHVNVTVIQKYVQDGRSLWGELGVDQREEIGALLQKVENLDFITPEFFINSIKKDFSGVASLFLNWPEAAEWLERQISELKSGLNEIQK